MSTTYSKIRAVLGQMSDIGPVSPTNLREQMLKRDKDRDENVFHIVRKGSPQPQEISEESFNQLFGEMILLKLIERTPNEDLLIQEAAKKVIQEESEFQAFLSRKVNEFFDQHGFKLSDVKEVAQKIQYPNVRDADTILAGLKSKRKGEKLGAEKFRRMLFLLACAEQRATRHMRVFYEFN